MCRNHPPYRPDQFDPPVWKQRWIEQDWMTTLLTSESRDTQLFPDVLWNVETGKQVKEAFVRAAQNFRLIPL